MKLARHQGYLAHADSLDELVSQINTGREMLSEANVDLSALMAQGDDDFWGDGGSFGRPYEVSAGVLHVPVQGALLHDCSISFGGMLTGYDYIRRAMQRGMEDPAVESIVLDVNSGGGMVAGCFDLVDEIYAMRGPKPITAVCNEVAFSAAYAIASAADRITIPRTGAVGSVGVITAHLDASRKMEADGVKMTLISAGSHKTDGNPYEPLPEEVEAKIQARVNATYALFISTVARNRNLSEESVRATEADIFEGDRGVSIGFADAIATPLAEVARISADINQKKEAHMADKTTAGAPEASTTFTQEDVNSARDEGKAAGLAEGAKAERDRIDAIEATDEAKARPSATKAALSLGLSVEDTQAFLTKLPEEAKAEAPADAAAAPAEPAPAVAPAAAAADPFAAAMATTGNPELGADGAESETSRDDAVMSTVRGLGLAGFKAPKET